MRSAMGAIIAGFLSHTMTVRSGSRNVRIPKEFSSTALTALKMAVLAPMPRASARIAMLVRPGLLRIARNE